VASGEDESPQRDQPEPLKDEELGVSPSEEQSQAQTGASQTPPDDSHEGAPQQADAAGQAEPVVFDLGSTAPTGLAETIAFMPTGTGGEAAEPAGEPAAEGAGLVEGLASFAAGAEEGMPNEDLVETLAQFAGEGETPLKDLEPFVAADAGVEPAVEGAVAAEAVDQLRAEVERPLQAVAAARHPQHAVLREGVPGPGAAFMQKPFAPNELAQKIREMLDAGL